MVDSRHVHLVYILKNSFHVSLSILSLQNEALSKMKTLNDIVMSGSQKTSRQQVTEDMKLCIKQESYQEALSELLSPLNPNTVLSEIW